MSTKQISLTNTAVLQRIADFIYTYPADNPHVLDLPYRLSSWSLEYPENVGLWEDENGRLLAVAIVQEPFLALDYALHPTAAALEPQVVQWGLDRAPGVAARQGRTFPLYVWAKAEQTERIALFKSLGLQLDDDWQKIHLHQSLDRKIEEPIVPNGFTVRHLAGEQEVEAYVDLHRAAFGSKNMTIPWRQRTLQMPQYVPELDVVAVDENGRFAAFCVCWLHPNGQEAIVEPLGVHPEFHRLGLGRAVLAEGLRQMQAQGAKTAYVCTDGDNDPAQQLYISAGFQVQYRQVGYGKLFYPA